MNSCVDPALLDSRPRYLLPPALDAGQQTRLTAGLPFEEVLNEDQQRFLKQRKKIPGALREDTGVPLRYVHALHLDRTLTFMVQLPTFEPLWKVACYFHPTSPHFHKHMGSRSKQAICGCVFPRQKPTQRIGNIAEIHLILQGLSTLTIIHEAVHAAAYISRCYSRKDCLELARHWVTMKNNEMMSREEIQCRLVEVFVRELTLFVTALSIPCLSMVDTPLF